MNMSVAAARTMAAAESDAATLRAQNESLMRAMASVASEGGGRAGTSGSATNIAAIAASPPAYPPSSSTSSVVAVPRAELLELERALKDKTSQVLLLRARYEHIESRAGAERELYDRALAALEEQNGAIREARVSLAAAEGDAAQLRARAKAGDEAALQVARAREENRRLERALTDLCDAPFVKDSGDAAARKARLEVAEQELTAAREQVGHLQHTVRAQHSELGGMRRERAFATETAEAARAEGAARRLEGESLQRANATLRERLALFSGVLGGAGGIEASADGAGAGAGVPVEELEQALALVRRRIDSPAAAAADAAALGKKIQVLQLALATGAREAERTEALLRAQTSIAADLSAEVADLSARLGAEGGDVRRRLADAELLAERRGGRVRTLEAQIGSLIERCAELVKTRNAAPLNGRRTSSRNNRFTDTTRDDDASTVISDLSGDVDAANGAGGEYDAATATATADAYASDDSALLASGAFGPGEGLIEVYIVGATLNAKALGRSDRTFAQLDFFDFESQSSPIAHGGAPAYNFSAAYTVPLDAFFLDYVARGGGVAIDIYSLRGGGGGEPDLFGRGVVPLHRLLSRATRAKYATLPIYSLPLGQVVGTLRVELRSAVSLDAVWSAFVASHPLQGATLIAAVASARAAEDDFGGGGVGGVGATDNAATRGGGGGRVTSQLVTTTIQSPSSPANPPNLSDRNELIIAVVGAEGLRGAPRAYARFSLSLPGGDVIGATPVSTPSSNPTFADSRLYPLAASPALLAALARTPLTVALIDSDAAPNSATQPLGTAIISLAEVSGGGCIDGVFPLSGASGGAVRVRVSWARPLTAQTPRALARSSLSALFAPFDADGGGVKFGLLATLIALPEDAACAVERVRMAVAAAEAAAHSAVADAASAGSVGALASLMIVSTMTTDKAPRGVWRGALAAAGAAAGAGNGNTVNGATAAAALRAAGVAAIDDDLTSIIAGLWGGGGAATSGPPPRAHPTFSPEDLADTLTPLSLDGATALTVLRGAARNIDITSVFADAAYKLGHPNVNRAPRGVLVTALRGAGLVILDDAAIHTVQTMAGDEGGVKGGGRLALEKEAAKESLADAAVAAALAGTVGVAVDVAVAVGVAVGVAVAAPATPTAAALDASLGDGEVSDVSADAALALESAGHGDGEVVFPLAMVPSAFAAEAAVFGSGGAPRQSLSNSQQKVNAPCHAGAPQNWEKITALVLEVTSLTRVSRVLEKALGGAPPLLTFAFPGINATGTLVGEGDGYILAPWAGAEGAGVVFGRITSEIFG